MPPFPEAPEAHGKGRPIDHCPEHATKLRPASISVASEAVVILLLIERVENNFA
jgi:hypothetical protein